MSHTVDPQTTMIRDAQSLIYSPDAGFPEVVSVASELSQRTKALVLGTGAYSTANALAQCGFETTYVDPSPALRRKRHRVRGDEAVLLRIEHSEIRRYVFRRKYDLIAALDYCGTLSGEDWLQLLVNVQKNTKLNGYNIIIRAEVGSEDNSPARIDGVETEPDYSSIYASWKIVMSQGYFLDPQSVRGSDPVFLRKLVAKRL